MAAATEVSSRVATRSTAQRRMLCGSGKNKQNKTKQLWVKSSNTAFTELQHTRGPEGAVCSCIGGRVPRGSTGVGLARAGVYWAVKLTAMAIILLECIEHTPHSRNQKILVLKKIGSRFSLSTVSQCQSKCRKGQAGPPFAAKWGRRVPCDAHRKYDVDARTRPTRGSAGSQGNGHQC